FPCHLGDDASYSVGRELITYDVEDWLRPLLLHYGPASRSLWLIHEPPTPDLAHQPFWEPQWAEAIQRYRPLATISGHDHNKPLETGHWHASVGSTVCVNAGQRVWPRPG